jgi:hypothetical protein
MFIYALKVVSIACCVFLSHCRETPLEPVNLKDQVCSSWRGRVDPSSHYDYLVFYMRDNYGRTLVIYDVRTANNYYSVNFYTNVK